MTSFGRLPLAAMALLWAAGCGGGRNAEDKQLDSMREEIDKARDSQDRTDSAPRESAGPQLIVPEAYTSAPVVRPPPPVVQLGEEGPADDGAGADPQDTTPRPTIRVFGSARGGHNARVEDQVDESSPEGRPEPSASSSLDPDAKRAYDSALSLVNAKRYDQALDALAAFLLKWPDHPYADNATYWRGQCYFARGDYLHASEQFEGVLSRFPGSEKVPDALLALGLSHIQLGHSDQAKACFDRLIQQYPDSDAAHRVPSVRAPPPPCRAPRPRTIDDARTSRRRDRRPPPDRPFCARARMGPGKSLPGRASRAGTAALDDHVRAAGRKLRQPAVAERHHRRWQCDRIELTPGDGRGGRLVRPRLRDAWRQRVDARRRQRPGLRWERRADKPRRRNSPIARRSTRRHALGYRRLLLQEPLRVAEALVVQPSDQEPELDLPGRRAEAHPGATAEGGAAAAGGRPTPLPYANGQPNLVDRRRQVPGDTVFLRDEGWIRDDSDEVWGEVTGAAEDKMFLSDFDQIYLRIEEGHDVHIGQELTLFRPVHPSITTGTIVMIEGTARIDQWNSRDRVARAVVVETLNVVERGAKVGPLARSFEIVPPRRNETEVQAHILASVHPHEFFGQNQVVFIDKGESAGLKLGNRLFVVRRGDPWRQSLVEPIAGYRVSADDEKPMPAMENTPGSRRDDRTYPDEVTAELRVVALKKDSATCVVTQSTVEIERDEIAVSRAGY